MSEHTDISRYNPYKAAYNMHTEIDPAIAERVAAVYEILKVKHTKKYQRIQRQKAMAEARRPIIEATLDDPSIIAMLDEMNAKTLASTYHDEFALLGIEPSATKRDIKNAYRRASYRLHPDSGKPTADAEKFKQVHEAYRKLLKVAPNE
jgi:preprotein translocase subunit Sec63